MYDSKRGVLEPLIYSSLFSFPLTSEEIRRFSSENNMTVNDVKRIAASLYPLVQEEKGYYFLNGQERSVSERLRGIEDAKRKYDKALTVVKYLSYLPTIKLVALSGSSALGSTSEDDDIDLFIITGKHTLYGTRLLLLTFLQLMGVRKRWNRTGFVFCVNMLLDERHLAFSKNRQDMYTAREIVQMRVLFNRSGTLSAFLRANSWYKTFFPQAEAWHVPLQKNDLSLYDRITIALIRMVEYPALLIQRAKLRRDGVLVSSETGVLMLHTSDYRMRCLRRFHAKKKAVRKLLRMHRKHLLSLRSNIDKGKNIFYTA